MTAMDIDGVFSHAAFAAAGEIQMESHEVGIEHVAESDVRRAMRRALQMQLGPYVRPEGAKGFRLPDWPGRLLGPDVVVSHPDDASWRAFGEAKWCRENTMFEVFWDLLKISLAIGLDRVEAGYLIVGGPSRAWPDDAWRCAALIDTGSWNTAELFERYRSEWLALLGGNKTARPTRLPSTISTTLLASVPIHLAVADDWQLRLVRVDDPGQGWIDLSDGWPTERP